MEASREHQGIHVTADSQIYHYAVPFFIFPDSELQFFLEFAPPKGEREQHTKEKIAKKISVTEKKEKKKQNPRKPTTPDGKGRER